MTSMVTYKDLETKIKTYLEPDDIKEIKKAYLYANEKHAGQKRMTGDDYIVHPLSVALILANMKADKETICSGLLHDVLEDTEAEKEDLVKQFGEEVKKNLSCVCIIKGWKFK